MSRLPPPQSSSSSSWSTVQKLSLRDAQMEAQTTSTVTSEFRFRQETYQHFDQLLAHAQRYAWKKMLLSHSPSSSSAKKKTVKKTTQRAGSSSPWSLSLLRCRIVPMTLVRRGVPDNGQQDAADIDTELAQERDGLLRIVWKWDACNVLVKEIRVCVQIEF